MITKWTDNQGCSYRGQQCIRLIDDCFLGYIIKDREKEKGTLDLVQSEKFIEFWSEHFPKNQSKEVKPCFHTEDVPDPDKDITRRIPSCPFIGDKEEFMTESYRKKYFHRKN